MSFKSIMGLLVLSGILRCLRNPTSFVQVSLPPDEGGQVRELLVGHRQVAAEGGEKLCPLCRRNPQCVEQHPCQVWYPHVKISMMCRFELQEIKAC